MPTGQKINTLRNYHFMRVVRRLLATGHYNSLAEVAAAAAREPAPQYYVSYDYALRRLRKGKSFHADRTTMTEDMWRELGEKVACVQEMFGIDLGRALQRVLTDSKASSFFLSPASALRLYYQLRRSGQYHISA